MQAFQIKEETCRATRKMVETEGGKVEFQRKKQIKPRKKQTKENFGKGVEKLIFEGAQGQRQHIVKRPAHNSERGAEKKSVEMAHLNSPESAFAPP